MQSSPYNMQERQTEEAFNRQAPIFDGLYSRNKIIQYKRERVRSHVERFLQPAGSILELNAGTGEDAVYFASKGHHIHATDISGEMQTVLTQKVSHQNLQSLVSTEVCSFNDLQLLKDRGPYDLIFSNFAGLNCTADLDKILPRFSGLLKNKGLVTLVIMPGFCLWESLLLLRGNFKTAFRRVNSRHGVKAHIEGTYFKCWYYSPAFIASCLAEDFQVISVEGLCTIVPPSYFENFPSRHPGLYARLQRIEDRLKERWPWKCMGDYFIITLRRKY